MLATMMRRATLIRSAKSIQDYVVVGPHRTNNYQHWIDGVASCDGTMRRFVAMKSDSGYSKSPKGHRYNF